MKLTPAQDKIRAFNKTKKALTAARNKAQNERSKVSTLVDAAESRLITLQQRLDKFNRAIKTLDNELDAERTRLISSLSSVELDKHLDEI